MSREIKFRAWDKEFSVMRDMHDLTFIRSEDYSSLLIEIINGFDGKDTRFHLMQYTGLKDRNGVEIYEGDVVEFISMNIGPRSSVVEWNPFDQMAGFQCKSPFINIFDHEGIRVIGNIHENPDLLK